MPLIEIPEDEDQEPPLICPSCEFVVDENDSMCSRCEQCNDCHEEISCDICGRCGSDRERYCECCYECARQECICCQECSGGEDHFCGECEGYTCWDDGCSCGHGMDGESTMLGYGHVPPSVEFRRADGHDSFPTYGREYPHAPDNAPYFGMELETECTHGSVSDIVRVWNESGHGWCTHDGSLSHGAECKTHPSTYDVLRKSLPETLVKLRDAGARAWDHESCGLHLHVNRKTFKSPVHQWRFAYLHVRSLKKELIKLAGRPGEQSHYARFPSANVMSTEQRQREADYQAYLQVGYSRTIARRYAFSCEMGYSDSPMSVIAKKAYRGNRSVAVNVNEETIELRFWKGNLNPDYVVGCIALEDALIKWAAVLRSNTIKSANWETFTQWAAETLPMDQFQDIGKLCDTRHVRFNPTVMVERKENN